MGLEKIDMAQARTKPRNTILRVLRLCVRVTRLLGLLVVVPPFWFLRRLVLTTPKFLKNYYLLLLGLALAPLLYFVLWVLPEWQVLPLKTISGVPAVQIVEAETHARAVWAQITGGVLLLVGLFFTYRRIEVAREGQITDRFIRAMELLGDEKEEIRLGAIYSLERIARDSAKDYWSVISILTAFVRAKRPRGGDVTRVPSVPPPLPADILAILGVLVRRRRDREGPEQRLNLSDTNLCGVAFKDVHFERAFFSNAILDRATFASSRIAELSPRFFRAKVEADGSTRIEIDESRWRRYQQRNLGGCHLEGANFQAASLWGAYLVGAYLEDANLANADLRGSGISNARLRRASFAGANLEGAMLDGADLRECSFFKTNLKNAQLYGADLRGARFWETDLDGAKFAYEDRNGGKPDLRGVNLKTAKNLTKEQIGAAITDEKTVLPDYLIGQAESRSPTVPSATSPAAQETEIATRPAESLENTTREKDNGDSTPS